MKRMNLRQRTALSPTSGARASAWRALAVVACAAVALACSLLCARNARADGNYQDVWNHQSLDGGQQYIVGAWNVYDAAAFVCGYSYSTVSGWDLPTLAKLSNAPAIVALADSFGNVTPWNDELLRDTCEGYFGSDLWNRMQSTYGGLGGIYYNPSGVNPVQLKYWQENMPAGLHVYALNTTSEMVGAAKEAFRSILAGEDTGGGGGATDGNLYFSGNIGLHHNTSNFRYLIADDSTRYYKVNRSTANVSWLPSPITVKLPLSLLNGLLDRYLDDSSYDCVLRIRFLSGGEINIRILYILKSSIPSDQPIILQNTIKNNAEYISTYNGIECVTNSTEFEVTDYTFDGVNLVINGLNLKGVTSLSRQVNYSAGGGSDISFLTSYSGGGDTPMPDPPNNWPDDDTNTTVAPSPPDLPTPRDPTIPTEPDPDPPTYYTPPTPDPPAPDPPYEPIEPTNTSPTDYTPWLRAILLALGGISSDMATHCQHLQAQMKAQATRIITGINNQLVNLGTSINTAIGDWAKWLGDCWGEGLNTLTDNLYDLFHWLAEQFDFTFSGDPYDDSGIIGWLRRIYNRLGNGGDPKHYAPTILDPGSEGEEEPFDFWAWLLERIASILGGVLGGATDAVSTLLEGIRGKFPFSIPWDLLAFLGMLSGDRAIPVFTFTIPAIQGWWNDVPIRVDLTPYDSAAQACRTMVLIWWAFILAMKSTWMINDVLGALGSSIVSRFTGRLVGTAS